MCIRDSYNPGASFNGTITTPGGTIGTLSNLTGGVITGGQTGIGAVSYTHLDVYKRQPVITPPVKLLSVPIVPPGVVIVPLKEAPGL